MHDIGGRQAAQLDDAILKQLPEIQRIDVFACRLRRVPEAQGAVPERLAEPPLALGIAAAAADFPHQQNVFVQKAGVPDAGLCQRLQIPQDGGVPLRGHTQRMTRYASRRTAPSW